MTRFEKITYGFLFLALVACFVFTIWAHAVGFSFDVDTEALMWFTGYIWVCIISFFIGWNL